MKPVTRRVGLWAAAALGLPLLMVALGEAAGWPFLRQPLQDALARATGVPVLLEGRFHTRLLWRPRLEVEHLRVGAGGGVQAPHLVDAREVLAAWRWADVWHWRQGGALRVQRLEAGTLDARLLRGADGRASWQLGAPRAPAGEPDADSGPEMPRFGSLRVRQGLVLIDDQPLDTALRIEVQGGEGDAAAAARGYRARVAGRYRALRLNLQLRSGAALPLVDDSATAPLVPLQAAGRAGAAQLSFNGQAGVLLGARRLRGTVRLSGPSLGEVAQPLGVTLPRTPPFDLRGRLSHDQGVWQLQAERAAIGRSLLAGDFRHDTRARPARLTGRLAGPRLALADLGPAVGTRGPAERAATPGRVLPQRRYDLPTLRAMDADVQVAIAELDLGSAAIAPLQQLQARVRLDGGVLRLDDLQARAAGGRFAGSTRLQAQDQPARWTLDLRFEGVDMAGWLRALRQRDGQQEEQAPARPDAAAPPSWLTGTLGGAVQGTGQGRSAAEFLATLDGTARLTLRNGSVSHLATEAMGLDVAQALGVLVRGDRPLPLRCARLDLVVAQGVVRPRLAVLDNADSTLRLTGQVDLRNETLALRATSKPKDASPLSLRAPLTVAGTLADPQISVDGRQLAGKMLGAAVLGAVAGPLAAMVPLVEGGSGDTADPCSAQAQAAAAAADPASAPAAASQPQR